MSSKKAPEKSNIKLPRDSFNGKSPKPFLRFGKLSSKKGQVEFMETFMVLVVIFLILAIGIYFFFKFMVGNVKTQGEETCIQTTSQMLQYVTSIPEIKCTTQGIEEECMDIAKVIAYQDAKNQDKLKQGNCPKSIAFEILYPKPKTNATCTDRHYQSRDFPNNCNIIELYKPSEKQIEGKQPTFITAIVSLYFPEFDEYRMGKLTIGAYL